ncbi:MAG: nickel-binding protein [Gaiellaceae bacterium]
MAEFLVEVYRARADTAATNHVQRARAAAEELNGSGTPVRYLRSIFIPEDETCFYLYRAESADAVRKATLKAELPFARIVEARSDPT